MISLRIWKNEWQYYLDICIFYYNYSYIKLCITFSWISDKNLKYISWVYYFGSPKNFGQNPPLLMVVMTTHQWLMISLTVTILFPIMLFVLQSMTGFKTTYLVLFSHFNWIVYLLFTYISRKESNHFILLAWIRFFNHNMI